MKKYNVILLLISMSAPAIAMHNQGSYFLPYQPQPPLQQFPTNFVVTPGNRPAFDALNANQPVDLIAYERYLRSRAPNGQLYGGDEAHIRQELAILAAHNNAIHRK